MFEHYELDGAHDEMLDSTGAVRPHYQHLYEALLELPADELRRRQQVADLTFLHQGITFTVYGRDEGTERIFPNDLLPRILTGEEWTRIERGLAQRITALNLFLNDVYHEGRILNDGVVPRELVYSCKHFRRQMRGFHVRRDAYVTVAGTDLIRTPAGEFVVLEDNLRVPSGRFLHAGEPAGDETDLSGFVPEVRSAGRSSNIARRCCKRCGSLAPQGCSDPTSRR